MRNLLFTWIANLICFIGYQWLENNDKRKKLHHIYNVKYRYRSQRELNEFLLIHSEKMSIVYKIDALSEIGERDEKKSNILQNEAPVVEVLLLEDEENCRLDKFHAGWASGFDKHRIAVTSLPNFTYRA